MTGAQRIIPHHSNGVLGPPPTSKVNQNVSNSTIPFRRITNQEARERRANGLCYYCDEKFVPGHCCQKPQLFMIEDSNQINLAKEPAKPESEDHKVMLEVSAYAISGSSHLQTFREIGKLKNKPVMVLIDGDSTHNFIDQAVVTKYGLPILQNKKVPSDGRQPRTNRMQRSVPTTHDLHSR